LRKGVLLFPWGGLIAALVLLLPDVVVTGFFAFSLVALIYPGHEGLLVEAHETPHRP